MINLAKQLGSDVGKKAACEALQVPRATFYRYQIREQAEYVVVK